MQVPRISAAFGVQPPLFLIKEFDNSVIFPSDGSGKFNPSAFISGATYEVQGNTGAQGNNHPPTTSLSPYAQVNNHPTVHTQCLDAPSHLSCQRNIHLLRMQHVRGLSVRQYY